MGEAATLRGHSLSAMQHVHFLQLPHILFQGRVLKEVIQHVAAQSLEGNIRFRSALHAFRLPEFFLARRPVSHLHEELDALVVTQEVVAQLHPLRHQVQDLALPLQGLPPILLPPAALGTVGGVGG